MATVTLGKRPKTFKPFTVSFTGPEGEPLDIPDVAFKYRTRSEFNTFTAELADTEAYKPAEGESFSTTKFYEAIDKKNVGALVDCIASWGLDVPVNAENLAQLQDELPAGSVALWTAYGQAAREGRLGN